MDPEHRPIPAAAIDIQLTSRMILTAYELESIGCMTVEASGLEEFMDDYISGLMRGEQKIIDLLVPENATLGVKANILRSLVFARTENPEILAEYQKLHDRLTTAIAQRNIVVHGVWRSDECGADGPHRVKSTTAAVKKRKPEVKVNAGAIMLIAKDLSERAVELLEFFARHEAFLE